MRAFASSLRAEAEAIAARAAWLARRAGRMRFEGPAASAFKQTMLDARRSAERTSGELREIANYVLSATARLETDLLDWRRRIEAGAQTSGQAT